MRIQCSWTFCRSVTSATSRPYSVASSPMTRSCVAGELPPSMRTRNMKYGGLELLGLEQRGLAARGCPARAACTGRTSAAAAQVGAVDAVEAALAVDVQDP
jgi:hypothetical protein